MSGGARGRRPSDSRSVATDRVDLDAVLALDEFEPLARPLLAPAVYDYVAGGSWDEESLAANVAAWRRRTLRPRVLVDVRATTAATTLLGRSASMPVAIAPMAAHGDLHPDGELATVRAAAAAGTPMTLSTFSTRTLEEVAGRGARTPPAGSSSTCRAIPAAPATCWSAPRPRGTARWSSRSTPRSWATGGASGATSRSCRTAARSTSPTRTAATSASPAAGRRG